MLFMTICIGFLMLLLAVFAIATSSIGIQCYNKNSETMKEYKKNRTFIITNLVFAVIAAIIALITVAIGFKSTEKVAVVAVR
jgi:hypothetical protein